MSTQIDELRMKISSKLDRKQRSELGQFMTPSPVATFMASLFSPIDGKSVRLLDAGAGIGSLTDAFLSRLKESGIDLANVEATAYEVDDLLRSEFERTVNQYSRSGVTARVFADDYIEDAVNRIQFDDSYLYTHAILNPPYKKISNQSRHRMLLRQVGIETVNLYSAFVALSIAQMAPGGQIVAIIPRSFCNGPYYKPFREYLLERTAIKHIHLFASRNKAFKDDDVLQENVIIVLERGPQSEITVSTSTDSKFSDYAAHAHSFARIVFPEDPERFIHVPTTAETSVLERLAGVRHSLTDIGLEVSTGPVVDFRLKEHLREQPETGSVPLLYPVHFPDGTLSWPLAQSKKPNSIARSDETEKWLYPTGFYTVVRRFSSKEEKRRVTAGVIDPTVFPSADVIGIENHLNVFHSGRHGIPETLARGLSAYLNTFAVDEHFRRFNGHTQVNATDLRLIRYPSRETLVRLGEWIKAEGTLLTQEALDRKLEEVAA